MLRQQRADLGKHGVCSHMSHNWYVYRPGLHSHNTGYWSQAHTEIFFPADMFTVSPIYVGCWHSDLTNNIGNMAMPALTVEAGNQSSTLEPFKDEKQNKRAKKVLIITVFYYYSSRYVTLNLSCCGLSEYPMIYHFTQVL